MRGRVCPSVHGLVGIHEHERRPSLELLTQLALSGPHSAEVVDSQRISFALGHSLKPHDHLFLLARRNRKDSRAEQSISHPFEKGGIALASNDLFVDLTRLVGIHCFTGDHLSIDGELEVLECGTLRQRKHEVRFTDSASTIYERLSDFVPQHAIDELDTHVAALPDDVRRLNLAHRSLTRHTRPAWRSRTWPSRRALNDLGGNELRNAESGQ